MKLFLSRVMKRLKIFCIRCLTFVKTKYLKLKKINIEVNDILAAICTLFFIGCMVLVLVCFKPQSRKEKTENYINNYRQLQTEIAKVDITKTKLIRVSDEGFPSGMPHEALYTIDDAFFVVPEILQYCADFYNKTYEFDSITGAKITIEPDPQNKSPYFRK